MVVAWEEHLHRFVMPETYEWCEEDTTTKLLAHHHALQSRAGVHDVTRNPESLAVWSQWEGVANAANTTTTTTTMDADVNTKRKRSWPRSGNEMSSSSSSVLEDGTSDKKRRRLVEGDNEEEERKPGQRTTRRTFVVPTSPQRIVNKHWQPPRIGTKYQVAQLPKAAAVTTTADVDAMPILYDENADNDKVWQWDSTRATDAMWTWIETRSSSSAEDKMLALQALAQSSYDMAQAQAWLDDYATKNNNQQQQQGATVASLPTLSMYATVFEHSALGAQKKFAKIAEHFQTSVSDVLVNYYRWKTLKAIEYQKLFKKKKPPQKDPITGQDLPPEQEEPYRVGDHCAICQDGGFLFECSSDNCGKAFHFTCLGMDAVPSGDWFCEDCRARRFSAPPAKTTTTNAMDGNTNVIEYCALDSQTYVMTVPVVPQKGLGICLRRGNQAGAFLRRFVRSGAPPLAKSGDRIAEIDNVSVENETYDQVVHRLKQYRTNGKVSVILTMKRSPPVVSETNAGDAAIDGTANQRKVIISEENGGDLKPSVRQDDSTNVRTLSTSTVPHSRETSTKPNVLTTERISAELPHPSNGSVGLEATASVSHRATATAADANDPSLHAAVHQSASKNPMASTESNVETATNPNNETRLMFSPNKNSNVIEILDSSESDTDSVILINAPNNTKDVPNGVSSQKNRDNNPQIEKSLDLPEADGNRTESREVHDQMADDPPIVVKALSVGLYETHLPVRNNKLGINIGKRDVDGRVVLSHFTRELLDADEVIPSGGDLMLSVDGQNVARMKYEDVLALLRLRNGLSKRIIVWERKGKRTTEDSAARPGLMTATPSQSVAGNANTSQSRGSPPTSSASNTIDVSQKESRTVSAGSPDITMSPNSSCASSASDHGLQDIVIRQISDKKYELTLPALSNIDAKVFVRDGRVCFHSLSKGNCGIPKSLTGAWILMINGVDVRHSGIEAVASALSSENRLASQVLVLYRSPESAEDLEKRDARASTNKEASGNSRASIVPVSDSEYDLRLPFGSRVNVQSFAGNFYVASVSASISGREHIKGDRILQIDGVNVASLSPEQVAGLLRHSTNPAIRLLMSS